MMPQQPQPQAWPPNPTAAVSIRGLFKRFDQKIAVNGLALDIPIGSFYGLVGPNGAGKTTTLNMVTGLLVPDAGTAMILGHDVWSDVNTAKRMIGVMPQPDQIFDRLTGLQLLIYSGMLRGMSREETTRRAKDLLNAFDLAQAANTMVTDYSAGMTKKICLASAMIHSPCILVLDEPESNLDFRNQLIVLEAIERLCREKHISAVVNTHYPEHALSISQKALLLTAHGTTLFGPTDEILSEEHLNEAFGVEVRLYPLTLRNRTYTCVLPLGLKERMERGA